MADVLDNAVAQYTARIAQIDADIETLRAMLNQPTDTQLVDSTSQQAGYKGSQRLKQLLELREYYQDKLNKVPFEAHSELAHSTDVFGGDTSETTSSLEKE